MFEVKRKIQITILVLVLISSTLLGLSMESMRMIAIGVVGAIAGFIVTDSMKWFRLEGVLANIASIVILFIAMYNFFSVDNAGKLTCVANLLVYLQTVLMFQDKTPRLIWQVLVLSLLQVVVGAIFSLNLEAGILFLLYFGVAGLCMLLQSVYTDAFDIQRRNKRASTELRKLNASTLALSGGGLLAEPGSETIGGARSSNNEAAGATALDESVEAKATTNRRQQLSRPLTFFDPPKNQGTHLRSMVWHLSLWIVVATAFTLILFYMVPRHSKPWFGPTNSVVSSVGVSKSVDLDERGLIEQSNAVMFRVNFRRVDDGPEIELEGNSPYFRGLALSSLVIEDGKTDWQAPHDRVFTDLYQDLPYFPSRGGELVYQTITMEETVDPLIYGLMPFYRASETPKEISFCHEVSAITRSKLGDSIGLAPYTYASHTLVDNNGQFAKSWPYISNTLSFSQNPMSDDPMQWKWLTYFDAKRYPKLVQTTKEIAAEVKVRNGSQLDLFKKLESYFYDVTRFGYTLDYRNVEFDDNVDPIEDFFGNHRTGHCELFASALTIMLRQQNIPARLVVGFYSADRNKMTGNYLVRARHAHAWVEAYLPPEDCTPEMFASGQAGKGGAWVILDPTPLSIDDSASGVGEEAIDLARSVWDDYVLGVETEARRNRDVFGVPFISFLSNLDVTEIDRSFQSFSDFTRRPAFKYLIAGAIVFLMFLVWLRARLFSTNVKKKAKKSGRLRRFVAGAISLISPGLGNWVLRGTSDANPTEFYLKLTDILERHELERDPSQTHREFADEVSSRFEDHPSSGLIQSTVAEVTEIFNEVRFGRTELDVDLSEQIDLSLKELESALA